VVNLLRELGQRLELEGANPYRARAYARAADSLSVSPYPLGQLVKEGRLTELPGVGDALAAVIEEIHQTGTHSSLKSLRQKTPPGVLEMIRIPGLRPERIRKIYQDLGVSSVSELEEAVRSGRLDKLKGYGPAWQGKVLQGIEMIRGVRGRHLHTATSVMANAIKQIRAMYPDWKDITIAGDLRRASELVRQLAVVAVDPKVTGPGRVVQQGELSIHLCRQDDHGITLLRATGSDKHIAALAALAREKGLVLDDSGLHRKRKIVAKKTEEAIYRELGLPFIPPELRETGEEVRMAERGKLPKLVSREDLHGVLHAHTAESDGSDTLADMAMAAERKGFSYLGLTDHSQSAHYAGGLKPAEVAAQQAEIDGFNKRTKKQFYVFKGTESDILGDGSLDYPENVLRSFDLVVASVHSKFRMDTKEQTDRIVRAIKNPHTTILGHVTGRQLLRRPGYEVDMERILRACAKYGVAIEINGHPWRLDMDWRWCRHALELGCWFSINPDAHSTSEIDNIQWGVLMARKGGVPKERVLNALSLDDFRIHLEKRRRAAAKKSKGKAASRK
jgi:DNA polymerase (family 10)